MNSDSIVTARIHPAIGIARVGNARGEDDYFIGPEVPNRIAAPPGGYRDKTGRLKRQAARFRIYGYDRDGKVVSELSDANAQIEWHVHVANKKAAWYNFDVALDLPEASSLRSPRRNADIQGAARAKLVIDPGVRSVSKSQTWARFDAGTFFDTPVDLGEIRYEEGRLIFLGGYGKSAGVSPEYSLVTFANNPGWYDDTSDGPVSATVKVGGRDIPVDPAWVITGPPNYAPDLVASQTLCDVIRQVQEPKKSTPSFTEDILPIFQQFIDAQWVNAGFAAQFGWRGLVDFMRPEFIEKLGKAPVKNGSTITDPYQEMRRQIFYGFRDPSSKLFDPLRWPPLYGDAFFSFSDPPSPRVAFTITKHLYYYLQQWMLGNFDGLNSHPPREPQSLDDVDLQNQPDTLDRAALHFCVGGPFHPGCEVTWTIRRASMYRARFRLRRRMETAGEPDYGEFMTADIALADGGPLNASGPGDITRWLAVPWQTDTASCRAGYGSEFPTDDLIPAFWPSRVPDTVLTEGQYGVVVDRQKKLEERAAAFQTRDVWVRGLDLKASFLDQIGKMVDHFHELGVLERREEDLGDDFPPVMYVETLPQNVNPATVSKMAATPGPDPAPVTHEFQKARSRRRPQQG